MKTNKKWFGSAKYYLLGTLVALGTLAATLGVASASLWWFYQPKLPKGVQR